MSPRTFERPIRLLVIDDDEVDRMAIRRCLNASGIQATVDEVSDARDVVARLRSTRYDCVILDHHLPGETSSEVLARLRDAELDTPVLCVTGQDEEAGAASVLAGATDFLAKVDLSPARLARRLRYVLRLGRAEQQIRRVEGELEAERRLLQAVVSQLPTGVVVVALDRDEVLVANARAEAVLGSPSGMLVGEAPTAAVAAVRAALDQVERTGASHAFDGAVAHAGHELRIGAHPVAIDRGAVAVVVIDDVTDEVSARRAAERAAQARENLLAIVSHDLRGPLSAIGVAIDGLKDDDVEPQMRDRCVGAVQRSVARADRLIRDLLMAHQLEVGRLQLAPATVDVAALLDAVRRDHELVASQAGARIEITVDPGAERVVGDRDRLSQALANFVGNALRHARGTPTIELGAHLRPDGALALTVRDHGPGVSVEALPHVFDRYWQGRERRGGAGLGLAIARGIARIHGGDAVVANPPDGGAEFALVLPAA